MHLGVTEWHDWVRLYLYAGGLLTAILIIRALMVRRSWEKGRRHEFLIAGAMVCLILQAVLQRAQGFGIAWFTSPGLTALSVVGVTLSIGWLFTLIRYVPPWKRMHSRWRVRDWQRMAAEREARKAEERAAQRQDPHAKGRRRRRRGAASR